MAHSDTGTVIDNGSAALVVKADGTRQLLIPDFEDDATVPEGVLFLTAVMLRADLDPDFAAEQVDWMLNLRP